jgi:hypothetical protein
MQPEDVRRMLDQLRGQGVEPVGVPFGIAIVDEEVLPLHIAEVVQPLLERWEAGGRY